MDEENGLGRQSDQDTAPLRASSRPEMYVKTTSNGHTYNSTISVNKDCEKKVNPLKIRISSKNKQDKFTSLNRKSFNIHLTDTKNDFKFLTGKSKSLKPEWKKNSVCMPKTEKNLSKSSTSIIKQGVAKCGLSPVKLKSGKGAVVKESTQSPGLQPTVKFKCRKCSSMSFKSLAMLKEHQRLCKSQTNAGEEDGMTVDSTGESRRVTKKVYLCSSCSTYYENWNLFLHMREVHNRHICLHCLGMFSKAERLTNHLYTKHGINEQCFDNQDNFQMQFEGALFLTCCTCEKLFTEKDNFTNHICDTSVEVPYSVNTEIHEKTSDSVACVKNDIKDDVAITVAEKIEDLGDTVINKKENSLPLSPKLAKEFEKSIESTLSNLNETLNSSLSESGEEDNKKNTDEYVKDKTEVNCISCEPEELKNGQESESSSSDYMDENATISVDSSTNENNNVTAEHEKEVGIKLKLSLNNSSSPIIINSTVWPNKDIKSHVRPSRPPGGRIVGPDEPIPMPAVQSNLSVINESKKDDHNIINRVPKLTVRVPRELIDKKSSSESSDSDSSDKLTVDDTTVSKCLTTETDDPKSPQTNIISQSDNLESDQPVGNDSSAVLLKSENIAITELTLTKPLDKYPLKELIKVFLAGTMYYCVYCNHARKIAVNCKQLALHMLNAHRFSATVESITAEELLPETIKQRVIYGLDEIKSIYINLDTYDSINPCELLPYVRTYECFQCYFTTMIHKELYLHNRKLHQKTILLCIMCKSNFYSYSELLCHLCPGTFDSDYEMKYRCCMCNMDNIPSSFRLMVHLRKIHHACDVCTEICFSQLQLSTHVWKHKLHHLCYRCGIAYRNKADITKHLFWKHGTESVVCKKCLQKKWPHIYHFCMPPASFVCEECNDNFSRAVFLKVHKRLHSETYPYPCTQEQCNEKFISKKLLAKHMITHKEHKIDDSDIILDVHETRDESNDKSTPALVELKKEEPAEELTKNDNCKLESHTKAKSKKKKNKDKDSFLLDVNLPALNLSESDSSEESDSCKNYVKQEINIEDRSTQQKVETDDDKEKIQLEDLLSEKKEDKDSNIQALDIWDNFKQYQAKIEKVKSPPLEVIRKHVCESDHDYCLIPNDMNGDAFMNDTINKRHKKKSPKKKNKNADSSSSSSSSSSSDSCCSRGSKCSCSSSSGSSSSSSSDSDSSSSLKEVKKKVTKNYLSKRRDSNGSHSSAVDVMALEDQQSLISEKKSPPIPETDLETEESASDEEFYDEYPQRLANKLHAEKQNQLMLLASVAPSDNLSANEDSNRPVTPQKTRSPKRKRKTKKRKKSLKNRQEPIKLNIPKDLIGLSGPTPSSSANNKLTSSLNSNIVQLQNVVNKPVFTSNTQENKRASKRRRVPNKFYGYSSDEEPVSKPLPAVRNDLKKEEFSLTPQQRLTPLPTFSHRFPNYNESLIRMSTPVPDPVPPPILMNTESMDSSDSDSSGEYELKIDQTYEQNDSISVPPSYSMAASSSSLALPKPIGVRQAREGESVYCYCRCPYDEVSEMIACDAIGCAIEWFHFECVGIMVPPKGKWYCPDCRQKQGLH